MSLMFKHLHPDNLKQIKGALKVLKEIWFHADGNVYMDKKNSDDRSIYHNDHPVNRSAKYRVHFTKGDPIPASLDELEKLLIGSYQEEEATKEKEAYKANNNNTVFSAAEDDESEEVDTSIRTGEDDLAAKLKSLKESGEIAGVVIPPKDKKAKGTPPVSTDLVPDPSQTQQ